MSCCSTATLIAPVERPSNHPSGCVRRCRTMRPRRSSCRSLSARWLTRPEAPALTKLSTSAPTMTRMAPQARVGSTGSPASAGQSARASSIMPMKGTTLATAPTRLSVTMIQILPRTAANRLSGFRESGGGWFDMFCFSRSR